MRIRLGLLREWIRDVLREADSTVASEKNPELPKNDDAYEVAKDAEYELTNAWENPEDVLDALRIAHTEDGVAMQLQALKSMATKLEGLGVLNKLGEGSSRTAYEVLTGPGAGDIVKIANNVAGLSQNSLEWGLSLDPVIGDMIPNVFKSYSDGNESQEPWIMVEKVKPIDSDEEFRRHTGFGIQDLGALIGRRGDLAARQKQPIAGPKDFDSTKVLNKKRAAEIEGQRRASRIPDEKIKKFVKGILLLQKRYNLLPGDVAKLDSWGVTKDDKLVLLDFGISKGMFEKLYDPRTGRALS